MLTRLWRRNRLPPLGAKHLNGNNRRNSHADDPRLDTKRDASTVARDPVGLEVTDGKPAEHTRHEDPRARGRSLRREDVEEVGGNRHRDAQGSETRHSPAEGDGDPAQLALERLAEEDETCDCDGPAGVDAPESVFRDVVAVVGGDVAGLEVVVEEMSPEFAEEGADCGGEEEQCKVGLGEGVGGREHEFRDCGHDADGPHCHEHYETEG